MDRYLPALQTVAYLSRTSPEVIGYTYALSGELNTLQSLASEPLDVLAGPEEVGAVLASITDQASALDQALEVVRQATMVGDVADPGEREAVVKVLDTLGPGVSLLRHATAGARSLVTMAEAVESNGFLSKDFGSIVGMALDGAQRELTLARKETESLQTLLSVQGIDAESFLPSIVFGGGPDASSSRERVEALLDEAINATSFLRSLLGYEEPRTYLLVGQNQNEIRATGGFIGIAVQATLDSGELTELVYHDSTAVDRDTVPDNPDAPEGLYWYLGMGKLLFRDANWNPHFPASAAQVAEIYRLGEGVQVDAVVTATKLLAFDMVELFQDIRVPGVEGVLDRPTAMAYAGAELPYKCLPHNVSRGVSGVSTRTCSSPLRID